MTGVQTCALPISPIACEKRGSTGFFEIVVENIAKKPSRDRYKTILRSGENRPAAGMVWCDMDIPALGGEGI